MKRIALWAVLGLLLAGCIVPSVYPYYTEKDLTFDPALVGSWASAQPGDDKEFWTFAKNGDNAYTLTMTKTTETNVLSARLFKLHGNTFMDWLLVPQDSEGVGIPSHYLMKVNQIQPSLKLSAFSADWITKYLEKNPTAIRHTMAPDRLGSADTHVVLTADTAELQKFFLKQIGDTNAFYEISELKRMKTK